METALETLQWNWSNWPGLKTLELNKLELVVDSRVSVHNVIEKLSLSSHYVKDHCPPSLKVVLFDVDLTPLQTNGQSLLIYKPYTDQILGLGQELDSIQKWNNYEISMRGLKMWKSMACKNRNELSHHFRPILAELEATLFPLNNILLLIASPAFQTLLQWMEFEEFLEECDLR